MDPNAVEVLEWAADDPKHMDMMSEASAMAQDREVQAMTAQERYERMDWLSYGAEREARGEERGEARGELNMLLKLVRDGRISLDVAASELGVTTDAFVREHMRPNEA